MPATRNVPPEIARLRGRLSGAVRRGDEEAARKYRQELRDIVVLAEAKKVAAQLPELTPEKREQVRALLGGA